MTLSTAKYVVEPSRPSFLFPNCPYLNTCTRLVTLSTDKAVYSKLPHQWSLFPLSSFAISYVSSSSDKTFTQHDLIDQ